MKREMAEKQEIEEDMTRHQNPKARTGRILPSYHKYSISNRSSKSKSVRKSVSSSKSAKRKQTSSKMKTRSSDIKKSSVSKDKDRK